ncbi:MAG: tetratricopeptide repeat protein [Chthonomonadales bacterium]|nr:tetratricopeptide repeat protein [Chthonomonadales bacterium]
MSTLHRLAGALALAASLCGAPIRPAAAAVRLDATIGLGGVARHGEWTPVSVRVSGSYRSVPAQLRATLLTPGSDTPITSYVAAVQLHAGRIDERHTLYVPAPYPAGAAAVRVTLAAAGRTVASQDLPAPRLVSNPLLVALTENGSGLAGLGDAAIGAAPRAVPPWQRQAGARYNASVVHPSPETLPDSPIGYAAADAVVLGDLLPDRLTDAQWSAITDWVRGGGLLVVCGGPDLGRLQAAAVRDLLPMSPADVRPAPRLSGLAYRYGSAPDARGAPVVTGALRPDATLIATQGALTLVCWRRLGSGAVAFTAFDATASAFARWPARGALWTELLLLARTDWPVGDGVRQAATSAAAGAYRSAEIGRLLDALAGRQAATAPSVAEVGGFLLLYIVLLVPVNYWILKRLDRKELAWFTAIGVVALFSTGAYAVGRTVKGSSLGLRYATVLDAAPGEPEAQAYTVATIYSPEQRRYDLSADMPGAGAMEVTGSVAGTRPTRETAAVDFGDRSTTVRGATVRMWDYRAFGFFGRAPLGGTLGGSLTPLGQGRLRVSIRNATRRTLRDCTLWTGERIGTLAPGAAWRGEVMWRPEGNASPVDLTLPTGPEGPGRDGAIARALREITREGAWSPPAVAAGPGVLVASPGLTAWIDDAVVGLSLSGGRAIPEGATLLVLHLGPPPIGAAPVMSTAPFPAGGDPFDGGPAGRRLGPAPGPVYRGAGRLPGDAQLGLDGPRAMGGAMAAPPASLSSDAMNRLAADLADQGRLDEALGAARQALAMAPNDGAVLFQLGEIQARRGDAREALRCYERAASTLPGTAAGGARLRSAQVLARLGRRDEAVKRLRALARDARSPWAAEASRDLDALAPQAADDRRPGGSEPSGLLPQPIGP